MTSGRLHQVRLPMYDWPEVREATEGLEAALEAALLEALGLSAADLDPWPDGLPLEESWQLPGLLLSQTCGYPLTHTLHGKVRTLGAPQYEAPGCDGHCYCSQIVVAKSSPFEQLEDLRGARAIINRPDSQSGMNAFRHLIAKHAKGQPFFCAVTESGSHLASLKAVAAGKADVASIDAVCWRLACREVPDLARYLRPIAQTARVPGLPLITSLRFSDSEAELIADTVRAVLSDPGTRDCRDRLGIRGFSTLAFEDYAGISAMEREAEALGYPELA